jgi:hypothetical protein
MARERNKQGYKQMAFFSIFCILKPMRCSYFATVSSPLSAGFSTWFKEQVLKFAG